MRPAICLSLVALLAPAAPVFARQNLARSEVDGGAPPKEAAPGRKQLRAARLDGAIELDGRLAERGWKSATFVSDFQKKGARRAFPSPVKTEVAILYDDEALYVGARAHAPARASVLARRSPRDDAANTDRIVVSLDTYRNRQTAYNFGVTAGGTRVDYYQPEDDFERRDYSFDPVWKARTSVGARGWTAEIRIPFASLRFHDLGGPQVWGINVQRVSPALQLYAFWVVVPGQEAGWASRFGDLVGLDGVRPVRRLAVVPYVAAESVHADDVASPGPFAPNGDVEWRYGADVLVDLEESLVLEATVNPDFGQVEADPAVINLSAYEVFFPEKRPFFADDAQLFQGGGPRYYYSRRIGAPPHGRAAAPFSEVPLDTTIQGAAKLVSRDHEGFSIGTLLALTDSEQARTFDPVSGIGGSVPVEPRTMYGVTRFQRDLGAGSSIGFVGTGVWRDLAGSGPLAELLPGRAWAAGADWNLRFGAQSHVFGGYLGGSRVAGEPGAILRLQGSSARYLQRPDADHVSLDPERTSLTGYTAGLNLARIAGAWRWSLSGEARSPRFEINDAGAMATADDLDAGATLSYQTPLTSGPLQRLTASASFAGGWNFGGIRQYATPEVAVHLVWRSFWQSYLAVSRDLESLSDSLTRGGPLMRTPEAWRMRFGTSGDHAKPWHWAVDGTWAEDELGGEAWSGSARLRGRIGDNFSFSVAPSYRRRVDPRQYYATREGDRPEVFGGRYVFATLDQHTASAQLRMSLAFTPSLSLELYVEPFVSLGSYDRFGELAAARGNDLRIFGSGGTTIDQLEDGSYVVTDAGATFRLPDRDFDVTSLRGNAVLRWDYARGSSLYVVWAQTRSRDDDPLGGRFGGVGIGDVFTAPARNVLAVKVDFRLDLR